MRFHESIHGVYFDDLDALQILHNARYLLLFERTIGSFWARAMGWSGLDGPTNPDRFHLVRTNQIEYIRPVTNIGDVRVFACGTGVPYSTTVPAFAQRLKTELVRRGYQQVMVIGYLGESAANYNFRKYVANTGTTQHASPMMSEYTAGQHKGTKDAQGDFVPASTRRVTF